MNKKPDLSFMRRTFAMAPRQPWRSESAESERPLPRLQQRFVQTQKLTRSNAQLTAPRPIAK